MTTREAFSKNLLRLMDRHNVKAKELADWCNMSPEMIRHLMRGICNPSLYTAYKIAKVFRVSLDDMVKGADED